MRGVCCLLVTLLATSARADSAVAEIAGDDAAAQCLDAMAQALDEGAAPAPLRAAFGVCARVYRAPGCRQAALRFAGGQGEAAEALEACGVAYCPRLAPEVCAAPFPTAKGRLAAWAQVQAAVWRLELGEARLRALAPSAARLQAAAERAMRRTREVGVGRIDVAAAPAPPADIVVRVDDAGLHVAIDGAHHFIARCGRALDVSALGELLAPQPERTVRLVASGAVSYQAVVALLNHLISDGFPDVSVSDVADDADRERRVAPRCGVPPRVHTRPPGPPRLALPVDGAMPTVVLAVSREAMWLDGVKLTVAPNATSAQLEGVLLPALRAVHSSPAPRLALQADVHIDFARIRDIMAIATRAGFYDIAFAVQRK